MKDLAITLRMCLGQDTPAPEGPGWYVYANGETVLIPPFRVAPQAALVIAGAFEQVVQGVGAQAAATPTQIVGSGNALVRQKLREELEFAEAQAQRIKALRQSLQALEEASDTVEAPERQE